MIGLLIALAAAVTTLIVGVAFGLVIGQEITRNKDGATPDME